MHNTDKAAPVEFRVVTCGWRIALVLTYRCKIHWYKRVCYVLKRENEKSGWPSASAGGRMEERVCLGTASLAS